MLRLRKVELFCFKSFSRRTPISFGGTGIAAIVGPNGCGKSNIADAILWVLGEQSPRTLRSGRMADCIFNGTATEPPTNLAEVTLTLVDPAALSNPAPEESPEAAEAQLASQGSERKRQKNRLNRKILPGEVVVTRRLYRSGESAYYLNGELCRLRDIQELFMGTGLGPESYAIIEQGRIGQILSSRPADRRALIEEAAGVTKYKTKRRLAEAKLQSAQQNLLRLNDIFEEVTKQLHSLKRQASRARRYQELKTEIHELRRVILASRLEALRATGESLGAQLQANAKSLDEWSAQVRALEQSQEQAQVHSFEFESSLRQKQNLAGQLLLELERTQARVAEARRQYDELGRQLEGVARQQEKLAGLLEQNAAAAASNAGALRQLEDELEATRAVHGSLVSAQETLHRELLAQEQQLQELQDRQAACRNQLAAVRAEAAQVAELAPATAEQLRHLVTRQEEAAREKARLAEERAAGQGGVAEARQELAHAQERLRSAEAALTGSQQRYREQKLRVEEVRQALAATAAQQEALAGLLAQRAAFAEPVQQLLRLDGGATAAKFRAVGVVADFAELDPQYAPLLEEYLHDELQYVVVETYEAARSGVQFLREQATGRATFLVDSFGHRPLEGPGWKLSEAEAATLHTGNGVLAPLSDFVRFNEALGQEAARVLPRLGRTYLVRSAQIAEEMARKHPQLYFLSPDGTWYQGRLVSGGTRNGHGPVRLKRELENAAQKKSELDPLASSAESDLQAAQAALEKREGELTAARQSLFAVEKDLLQREQRLQTLAAEWERWNRDQQQANHELQARAGTRDTLERRLAQLVRREKECAVEAAQLEESIGKARQALTALRQQAALDSNQLTEYAAKLAALEERRVALRQEHQRLQAEQENWLAEREQQELLQRQLRQQRAQLLETHRMTEQEVRRQEQEKKAAEESCQQLERELTALREKLLAAESQLRAARTDLEALRETRHKLEVERARLETEKTHWEDACQSEFGLTGAQLLAEVTDRRSGEALAQAEENYRQLKEKLENLGPINMMALGEYQECEQRHEFLSKQREDLLASIADTNQAIHEIDAVCTKQFEQAFAAVNQNFAETFRTLFGGGSATMRLTDTENPGESGIDLICQPPGKRLQNVLLLSGGEKALAALALLIAIFRYQPSPFCILDEVDAPLDEANVGRFTRLIQEMSSKTQFILITHNKKTMEICPVLYGITMQGGISQIVSVRFDEEAPTA